jgi:hypothetical protein
MRAHTQVTYIVHRNSSAEDESDAFLRHFRVLEDQRQRQTRARAHAHTHTHTRTHAHTCARTRTDRWGTCGLWGDSGSAAAIGCGAIAVATMGDAHKPTTCSPVVGASRAARHSEHGHDRWDKHREATRGRTVGNSIDSSVNLPSGVHRRDRRNCVEKNAENSRRARPCVHAHARTPMRARP